MCEKNPFAPMLRVLWGRPQAVAKLQGSRADAKIRGTVYFYQMVDGVLVAVRVTGLPGERGFFGFHIHSGEACTGKAFADTLSHYNPEGVEHPKHSGDLPPLLGNYGTAFQVFLTDRFCVHEILRKTVVIHSGPDDFTSQPAGNAGEKIACGRIEPFGTAIRQPL